MLTFPIKVNVKISEETDKAIKELAKKEQRSYSNMLRLIISAGIIDMNLEPAINDRHL